MAVIKHDAVVFAIIKQHGYDEGDIINTKGFI